MNETATFLMEKLRAKGGAYKSFKEYSKALRLTLLEKRYALEVTEKNYLQECLDVLQQNILVCTLPAVIERLEVISRHLGLKFMSGPSRLEWFISSDMFYVEVVLESNGHIKDVKIHHDGTADQQSCEEMKNTLEKRDFKDFTLQLEGLISIYNLNADKIIKSQAFTALQYLEADITQFSELQCMFMTDPFDIIHKSGVGFVQKRKGGHPMRIIYFISPYDLLDTRKNTYRPLTMDVPDVDYSVSLCLESSSTNKLQTKSLVKIINSEKIDESSVVDISIPLFDDLTSLNSILLPACFTMKLKERIPVCESIINQIKNIIDMDMKKLYGPSSILSLIKREIFSKFSDCEEDDNIVTLPDQRHCYVMTNNNEMQASVIQNIPFLHPVHVSQILPLLRQQALFNSVIASCIRPKAAKDSRDKSIENIECNYFRKNEFSNGFGLKLFGSEDFKNLSIFNESPRKYTPSDVIMFEVIPLSLQQITVSFEHPIDETLITVELDLNDISNLHCNISTGSEDLNTSLNNAQECASRALQRSFSIPATMRALMRFWENLSDISDEEDPNESSTNNDLADLNEHVENNMETESSKENNNCAAIELSNGVIIKLEKSENSENSFDGFSLSNHSSDYGKGENFTLPSIARGFQAFDMEVPSVTSMGHNFNVPISFIDNTNDQSAYTTKNESADFTKNTFLKNESASNLFGPKANTILIDSSSDSEPSDVNKGLLIDVKESSPGSTSSDFSTLTEMTTDLPQDKVLNDFEVDPSVMEMNNLEDVQQFLKLTENKIPKNENGNTLSSSVLLDHVLPNYNVAAVALPSSTTITLGSTISHNVVNSGEHCQNVENISSSLPSSTTLTRISSKDTDEMTKERKKLKCSDDKVRIEKTRKKRKRDDSPMGPPDKLRLKTDSFAKSISTNMKSVELGIPRSPSPSNTFRKYAVSPTQSVSILGKVSPNSNVSNNTTKKTSMTTLPGLSGSPKHSLTSSPKSMSSGSSGKPSMSALKSVVTSPSSSSKINNDMKKNFKESSGRENKEKKNPNGNSSMGYLSPKLKSSQIKFKQTEITFNNVTISPQYESTSVTSLDTKTALTQSKSGKKGMCLASVIDKLNKQQEDKCNNGNGKSCSPTLKDMKNSGPVTDPKTNLPMKISSEYMIKQHSSDGIKMTISNKSKKEQSSNKMGIVRNSVACSSGSPKPGNPKLNADKVIICKKVSSKPSSNTSGSNIATVTKHSLPKVSNSSNSPSSSLSYKSSKSNHSPKAVHSLDLNRKEKIRSSSKIHSDKSIFSTVASKRSSPSFQEVGESDKPYKNQPLYQPPVVFSKPLDTNFQIPKISDRNKIISETEGIKKVESGSGNSSNISSADVEVTKIESTSPMKIPFVNSEDCKIAVDALKTTPNTLDAKPKSTMTTLLTENNLDIIPNSSLQSQMSSNCSLSANVQSNDSIKVNL